jgi:hypothetical protein
MMDKLLPGLVLAALSGLTFVAYRHPSAFHYFSIPLVILLPAISILATAWDTGADHAYSKIMKFIKPDDWKAADQAVDKMKLMSAWNHFYVFVLLLYVILLTYLPRLLGDYQPV